MWSSLIQLVAAFGTLAAAIATFRTVREMRSQREAATRVEFAISVGSVTAVRSDEAAPYDAFKWTGLPKEDWFPGIECVNVGVASAKAVQVVWELRWDSVISDMNRRLEDECDPKDAAEVAVGSDSSISLKIGGFEHERWLPRTGIQCFPAVLPFTGQERAVYIEIPYRLRRLCDLAYDAWIRDGLGSRELLEATLRIEYQDLASVKHSQVFDMVFRSFDLDVDTYMDVHGIAVGERAVLDALGVS